MDTFNITCKELDTVFDDGGSCKLLIHNIFRVMWIRLDVVRMFIEHTCPPGQSTHPADAMNATEVLEVKIYFYSYCNKFSKSYGIDLVVIIKLNFIYN